MKDGGAGVTDVKRYVEKIGISIQLALLISFVALQACSAQTQEAKRQTGDCAQSNAPLRQLRAAWIATVTNTDWPSKPGLPVATQKQEFIRLLDAMQQMHMNAAIVQVKPTADAFYPSQYGPWSEYLTGVQG